MKWINQINNKEINKEIHCMVVKVWNLDSPWKFSIGWPCMALKVWNLNSPQKVDTENLSRNLIWTLGRLSNVDLKVFGGCSNLFLVVVRRHDRPIACTHMPCYASKSYQRPSWYVFELVRVFVLVKLHLTEIRCTGTL